MTFELELDDYPEISEEAIRAYYKKYFESGTSLTERLRVGEEIIADLRQSDLSSRSLKSLEDSFRLMRHLVKKAKDELGIVL